MLHKPEEMRFWNNYLIKVHVSKVSNLKENYVNAGLKGING